MSETAIQSVHERIVRLGYEAIHLRQLAEYGRSYSYWQRKEMCRQAAEKDAKANDLRKSMERP